MDGRTDILCAPELNRHNLSVYYQGWWHDILSKAKGVGEVQVREGALVMGSLTYARSDLFGMRRRALAWSHLTGPVLREGLTSVKASEVLDKLICQLPSGPFSFSSHSEGPYAEEVRTAFKNAGYEIGKLHTYTQKPDDCDPMERIKGYEATAIRKAFKNFDCISLNEDQFIELYKSQLPERGQRRSYDDLSIAHALLKEGLKRKQVLIYALREKVSPESKRGGQLHAAIAFTLDGKPMLDNDGIPLDEKRMYATWITYGKNSHRGAVKRLFVEGMRYAKAHGLVFDADGARSEAQDKSYQKLRFPYCEIRDVFTYSTFTAAQYEKMKPHLKKAYRVMKKYGPSLKL